MKSYARSNRVSGHIQKVLTDILHKKVKDPRLESVTITGVKVSSDLRMAQIYFTSTGKSKNIEQISEGFESARGYVKRVLAGQLGLRYMPDIQFIYDKSFDYGTHIDEVLKSIKTDNETDYQAPEK